MKLVNIDAERAAAQIVSALVSSLNKGKKVLLLVSGGSSVGLASLVLNSQQLAGSDMNLLTIGQVDERFGEVGHDNSNWRGLSEKTDVRDFKILPILTEDSNNLESTAQRYNDSLKKSVAENDEVAGIFGIGADGHTAGLLPRCPVFGSDELVGSYEADDYKRITISDGFFQHFTYGFGYAFGDNKYSAISDMLSDGPVEDIPARLLKVIPGFTLFTDFKGGDR